MLARFRGLVATLVVILLASVLAWPAHQRSFASPVEAASLNESVAQQPSTDPSVLPPLATSGGSDLTASTADPVVVKAQDGVPVLADSPTQFDAGRRQAGELEERDRTGTVGFDASTSAEDVSARSEFATVYDNVDGTSTAIVTLEPQHYRTVSGRWEPIDARLVPVKGKPSTYETAASSIEVQASPTGVSVTTAKGRTFSIFPSGVKGPWIPVVAEDGLSVVYPQVWPGVDLRFVVSAASVRKELVISGPESAASFDLEIDGLDLVADGKGGLVVRGDASDEVAVGAVMVFDRDGVPVPAADSRSAVTTKVAAGIGAEAGTVVSLSVSKEWLTSLKPEAFPVVLDPTFNVGNMNGYSVAFARDSSNAQVASCGVLYSSPCPYVYSGNASSTGLYRWRSMFAYDYSSLLPTSTVASTLVLARVGMTVAGGVGGGRTVYVRRATDYSWCGIMDNPATCTGSSNPWESATVDTGTTMLPVTSILQPYWAAGQPAIGWGFNGDEASGVQTNKTLTTWLEITVDRTAIVTGRSPVDNYKVNYPTGGMSLTATTVADPDPGEVTWHRFWVCTAASFGNCVLDSGWQQNSTYTPYAIGYGLPLAFYNKQLYWMVQTTSGTATAPAAVYIQSSTWQSWKWENLLPAGTPSLVSPATDFRWSPPATATLVAGPSQPDPENNPPIYYRFIVREKGAIGISTQSSWITASTTANTSWTIPSSAPLTPGQLYEWTVQVTDYIAVAVGVTDTTMATARSAKFDQRLGTTGPSPFQAAGPLTVNLANGNVSTGVSTVGFATVGGSLGASLSYDSLRKDTGLRGRYSATGFSMDRIDPTINFSWGTGAPAAGFPVDTFNVTWTGWVTVPVTGTYYFGAGVDDAVTVTVAGTNVLNISSCCVDAVFPSTKFHLSGGNVKNANDAVVGSYTGVALSAGVPAPITISYSEAFGAAHVELYASTDATQLSLVPSDWLTPDANPVPSGWTLNTAAGQDAQYVSALVQSNQIILNQVDGDSLTFERNATGGYTPPPGVLDQVSLITSTDPAVNGTVQVLTIDGGTYRFTASGQLDTYTPPVDSGTATTPTAAWLTAPGGAQRLATLTDPISGKQLQFVYANVPASGSCPAAGTYAAWTDASLSGLLCSVKVAGTSHETNFFYLKDDNQAVRLSRVVNPGNAITDFEWTKPETPGDVRLTGVRTPLQSDLVIAGKILPADRWTIGYSSGRVTSITAPKASASATTQEGVASINWSNTTETTLKLANLDAIYGASAWDRRVTFDNLARWTGDWNARSNTTTGSVTGSLERTAVWHSSADVMLEQRDHGRMTSYLYDGHFWLTDTYGPALPTCFDTTTRVPNGTCTTPPVAHTHTDYDTTLGAGGTQTAMTGLGATNYSTNNFTGRPSSLATVAATGGFSLNWGAGAPAGVTVVDNWSTRMIGDINLPTGGTWGFWITMTDASDQAALYIDDQPVIALQAGVYNACCGYLIYANAPGTLTAGVHRIRVDYVDGGGNALVQLNWNRPGVGNELLPSSALAPRYGLATRTTVDDSNSAPSTVTHTRYDQNGWDPAYGLPTSTIVDPAGQALTTSTGYDTLRRRISRTLPAGNTTTYTYYGNTEATSASITCADGTTIAAGVNQAGLIKTATSPAPATGAAIVYSTVYDILGRPVATRTGTDPWTCTTYDTRGRITKVSYPAYGGIAARTVTTTYSDTSDPQTVTIADPAGTITTKTDFLGRTIESTDATGAAHKVTTVYDTAGRVARVYGDTIGASTSSAGLEYTYDRGGFVTQVRLDGQPVAIPSYSTGVTGGELTQVDYPSGTGNAGNGTSGTITRNGTGATTGISWTGPGSTLITSDTVIRSQSGRIVDQSTDGVDPYTTGNNYTYDTAGRLTGARIAGGNDYQYAFAATGGCGANTTAGRNTNRTTATINGATVATFCYDNADRLTSVTSTTAPYTAYTGTITYDSHGNTTVIGGDTHVYDAANRHLATYTPNPTTPTSSVVYTRDALDNIVARTATWPGGTETHRYSNGAVLDASATTVLERSIPLPGGASLTIRGSSPPPPTTVGGKTFDSTVEGIVSWYNSTLAIDTATKRTGAGSLKITSSSAYFGVVDMTGTPQAVTGGTHYTFAMYSRAATVGANVNIVVRWLNSNWEQLGYTYAVPGGNDTTGTWTQLSASMIAPADATMVRIGLQINGTATGEIHYIDDYTLNSSAVTTANVNAKGFETTTDNMTSVTAATVAATTAQAKTGTRSLAITPSGAWTVTDATNGIAVTPANTYRLSGWAKLATGSGTMSAKVDWYNASNGFIRTDEIVQHENLAVWASFTTHNMTPPAGAVYAKIRLAGPSGAVWYVDDLILATVTPVTSTQIWSYPNIHGDIQATANAVGAKQGTTFTYDPYGNPLTTTPDNIAGGIDNTWLGQHNRWNERNTGSRPLVQMGARPYDGTLGRFLEKDPIEGGCLSDYVYPEDPVNSFDLSGLEQCSRVLDKGPWAVFRIKAGSRMLTTRKGRRLRGFNLIWNPTQQYQGNIGAAFATIDVVDRNGQNSIGRQTISGPNHSYGHSGFRGLHGYFYAGVGDTVHIQATIIWKEPIKIVRTLAADLVVGATNIDITCTV